MKIKYKAPLILLIFICTFSAISGYIAYNSNVKLIESTMQNDLQTVSKIIQNTINTQATRAASKASIFVNEPEVQETFRQHDREKLIKIVQPAFRLQHEKFGTVDGHFHLPSAVSFLRIYKTDTYGDDLSATRKLIVAAQKEQQPLHGIEISTTGVSIKGVDIVKDDQGFIGTLEVGVSFVHVLENVKINTGFDAGAFIDDATMNKVATSAPKPDHERIIGGFRNVFATDWAKIRSVVTPELMKNVNDVTYKVEELHGQFLGLVIVPLLDFKGAQIGFIWAVGNFNEYQKQLRICLITNISITLLQILFLTGLVMIIFKALLLLPIVDIDEKLHRLSQGKAIIDETIDLEIAHLTHRQDEVGSLARNLEKFTKYIANYLKR